MIPANSKINDWPPEVEMKSGINESQETDRITFRWDDLSENGKRKLVLAIKRCSPIHTVQKRKENGGLTIKEIYLSFKLTNPIIFHNWSNRFSYGALNNWTARKLSRIAFYICRRKPTEEKIREIKNNNKTTAEADSYWARRNPRDTVYMQSLLEEYRLQFGETAISSKSNQTETPLINLKQ